jgi:calcium-dependent protein kinase
MSLLNPPLYAVFEVFIVFYSEFSAKMGSCCVRDVSSQSESEKVPPQSDKVSLQSASALHISTKESPVPSPPTKALKSPLLVSPGLRASSRVKTIEKGFSSFARSRTTLRTTSVTSPTFFPSLPVPVKQLRLNFEEIYELQGGTLTLSSGVIMLATHRTTQTVRLILKIEKRESTNDEQIFGNIAILARLDHPNILKVDTLLCTNKANYVVSELFEGMRLVDYTTIAKMQSEAVVKRLALHILKGIAYSHSQNNLIRTLSILSILFFQGNSSVLMLKLIPLSNREKSTPSNLQNSLLMYTSPEALSGHFIDKSDIWSCGVILHLLLTNSVPFSGKNEEELKENIREGGKFSDKKWGKFDSQARLLISSMLAKDPRDRPTALECLAHPWLQDVTSSMPLAMPTALVNLRKFKGGDPLKLAILTFIAMNTLTPDEKLPLQDVFLYINTSGNGIISVEELEAAFAKLHRVELCHGLAVTVLSVVDVDKNGTLDFSEFLLSVVDFKLLLQAKRLKTAFDLFDPDSRGSITLEEFRTVLKYQEKQETWQRFMSEVDKDGNGRVDFGEFRKLVKMIIGEIRS